MFANKLTVSLKRSLLALALSAIAGSAAAAGLHVELDTSSFAASGNSGWLDLQFNPGYVDGALASATLSHFVGFDASQTAYMEGGVSGSLASGFVLSNSSAYNDLFHAVQIGGKVSFDVSFSGLADPGAAGNSSVFGMALYGADGFTQLGAPGSSLLTVAWTPGQGAGQAGHMGSAVADATVLAAPVPEASSWLMMGAGLALIGLVRRRKPAQPKFA